MEALAMPRPIISSPDICGGSPTIKGTRLTCANVVLHLNHEKQGFGEFLNYHPYLNESDLDNCVRYCSERQCQRDEVMNFCTGCSLDTRNAEPCKIADTTTMIGSYEVVVDEEEENEKEDIWKIAASLSQRRDNEG
jgi:uncharacterized protein (DUF433 family)